MPQSKTVRLPPIEGTMESMEGLFAYLNDLEPIPGKVKASKNRRKNAVDDNLLQKAKKLLWSISHREFRSNEKLRTKARELIKEIAIFETYAADTSRYSAAIGAPGCYTTLKVPILSDEEEDL